MGVIGPLDATVPVFLGCLLKRARRPMGPTLQLPNPLRPLWFLFGCVFGSRVRCRFSVCFFLSRWPRNVCPPRPDPFLLWCFFPISLSLSLSLYFPFCWDAHRRRRSVSIKLSSVGEIQFFFMVLGFPLCFFFSDVLFHLYL